MQQIFVKSFQDSKWEKHTKEKINLGASPDLTWCRLVDATESYCEGISVGCLRIPPGCELPLHTHTPQEVYFVKNGFGMLIKGDGCSQRVCRSDVVYIPKGEAHGLKNIGNQFLEIIWIFPTNTWDEIEYNYI